MSGPVLLLAGPEMTDQLEWHPIGKITCNLCEYRERWGPPTDLTKKQAIENANAHMWEEHLRDEEGKG